MACLPPHKQGTPVLRRCAAGAATPSFSGPGPSGCSRWGQRLAAAGAGNPSISSSSSSLPAPAASCGRPPPGVGGLAISAVPPAPKPTGSPRWRRLSLGGHPLSCQPPALCSEPAPPSFGSRAAGKELPGKKASYSLVFEISTYLSKLVLSLTYLLKSVLMSSLCY